MGNLRLAETEAWPEKIWVKPKFYQIFIRLYFPYICSLFVIIDLFHFGGRRFAAILLENGVTP